MPEICCVCDAQCEQPAGYRSGQGMATNTGPFKRLPHCTRCGEPVCKACSAPAAHRRRICNDCAFGADLPAPEFCDCLCGCRPGMPDFQPCHCDMKCSCKLVEGAFCTVGANAEAA